MNRLGLEQGLAAFAHTSCGEPLSPEVIAFYIEQARKEFGAYKPVLEYFEFDVSDQHYIDLPESLELVAVTGVYRNDSYVDGGSLDLNHGFDLVFMDAIRRERLNPEVDFRRSGKRVYLLLDNGLESTHKVKVEAYRLPRLEEIEESEFGTMMLFMKRAFLEDLLLRSDGLRRIPTPVGHFEFDPIALQRLYEDIVRQLERKLVKLNGPIGG